MTALARIEASVTAINADCKTNVATLAKSVKAVYTRLDELAGRTSTAANAAVKAATASVSAANAAAAEGGKEPGGRKENTSSNKTSARPQEKPAAAANTKPLGNGSQKGGPGAAERPQKEGKAPAPSSRKKDGASPPTSASRDGSPTLAIKPASPTEVSLDLNFTPKAQQQPASGGGAKGSAGNKAPRPSKPAKGAGAPEKPGGKGGKPTAATNGATTTTVTNGKSPAPAAAAASKEDQVELSLAVFSTEAVGLSIKLV